MSKTTHYTFNLKKNKYPYKAAKLVTGNRWYIEFYTYDLNIDNKRRIRLYKELETETTTKGKLRIANNMIKAINEKLSNDELVIQQTVVDTVFNPNSHTFLEVYSWVMNRKKDNLSPITFQKNYVERYEYFRKYLGEYFQL